MTPALLEKPYLIAFTKADLVPPDQRSRFYLPAEPVPQLFVSGATHEGLEELLQALRQAVEEHRGPQKTPQPWRP
ncbi:MAG: hypothetical protein KatS3mg026_0926 [Bacteroidia bacterium]|nr:MAG: hypothetical protein KatS3mg026_0926 [Bacteroidia bacterium]